jgi:hypothetical protein
MVLHDEQQRRVSSQQFNGPLGVTHKESRIANHALGGTQIT